MYHPIQKRIGDHTNLYDHFMSKSNVLQRLNKHVINTGSKQVDLSSKGGVAMSNDLESLGLMSVKQISAAVRDGVTYFTSLEGPSLHYTPIL